MAWKFFRAWKKPGNSLEFCLEVYEPWDELLGDVYVTHITQAEPRKTPMEKAQLEIANYKDEPPIILMMTHYYDGKVKKQSTLCFPG